MGFFSSKSESPSLSDLSDDDLKKLIKKGKVTGIKTPKDLRKASKDEQRQFVGETGVSALLAGMKGGGTGNRNYANVPLKDRVHPARYKQILEREARRQGL